jgi:gluconokinase
MDDIISSGQSAVLACSALTRKYRDDLVGHREQAVMVFLTISQAEDEARVLARKGHFFHEPLLASQFAALEPPDPAESRVHAIPTDAGPPGQLVTEIISMLGLKPVS